MSRSFRLLILSVLLSLTVSGSIIVRNPGCSAYTQTGVCKACSTRFYMDQNYICQPVNTNCKTYNEINGDCTSCYSGFGLLEGTCLPGLANDVYLDPNCNQFKDDVCVKCSYGYFFDQLGKCTKVDPTCNTFNVMNGFCLTCFSGYVVNQGKCVRQAPKLIDPNCNQFDSNNNCIKCSQGFVFRQGACIKIDDSCKNFDKTLNICTACYSGYILKSNQCVKQEIKPNQNPFCAQWKDTLCIKCAFGTVFDKSGMCIQLDSNCKAYQEQTNVCKACYEGYELNVYNTCVKSALKVVTDTLCAQWRNEICTKCSFGSFFNAQGVCTNIDASCKSANQVTGACLSCYDGYSLDSFGKCAKVVEELSDVNCAEWKGKVCLRCSFGAAFNYFGKCTILDSQCKQYDQITGLCKGCYQGYELNTSKICVKEAIKTVSDALCAQWIGQICAKCASGSYFGFNGKCTQGDTMCKHSNAITGACLACYDGYQLSSQGTCVKVVQDVSDVNCAQWNGKTCVKCSFGASFNSFGKCVILDPQCKQYDLRSGKCKACYSGYTLNASLSCVQAAIQQVKDKLCGQWTSGGQCKQCSQGAYFGAQGFCVQVDPLCLYFNKATGQCLGCYGGYQLSENKCVKAPQVKNSNPLCAEWDKTVQYCFKCASGSFFNAFGICQTVDTLCRTSNALNGACTSCFDGYKIEGSKCIVAKQQARDPLCKQFNGKVCVQCSFGSYFNSQGLCQLPDASCLTYNKITGACLTCYTGYKILEGKCEIDKDFTLSDPFCAQFQNNICVRCSDKYYFEKDGKCTRIDPLCATYNQMNGKCLSCFTGYQLKSGLCVIAAQKVKDPNCASFKNQICVECSKGFIFGSNGLCSLINPLCKTYNSVTGACLTCYSGYVVDGVTCIIDKNAESSNCAEYENDICIRCAERTFMNSMGLCEKVSEDCRTYNDFTGKCLSCYPGYLVKSGKCIKDQIKEGCSSFDANGVCIACAYGFYFNNGSCSRIDPQCAKFNLNIKACEGCYSGYTLLEGKCEIAKVNEQFEVKNCVAYNTENSCIQCFDRFYLSNNQCKQVSIFCKTYDLISGKCTTCYSTFSLQNGQCKK